MNRAMAHAGKTVRKGILGRLGLGVLLSFLLVVPAFAVGEVTVVLKSKEGKKLTATLLEKGPDAVKVQVGRKIHVLPFDKLAPESVALVKKAHIPIMCDFELKADFSKRSEKIERNRKVPFNDGTRKREGTVTDSYRLDEVGGKITLENRDVIKPSPAGTLHVAVLCREGSRVRVMRVESHPLAAMDPLTKVEFVVEKSKCWHTERGESIPKADGVTEGRYTGYLAAIVVDGQITLLQGAPSSYEKEERTARKLLGLPPPVRVKTN